MLLKQCINADLPKLYFLFKHQQKYDNIRLEVFSKTAVLNKFPKFKKMRVMESFILEVADSSFIILLKIRLHRKCFPKNFAKFF